MELTYDQLFSMIEQAKGELAFEFCDTLDTTTNTLSNPSVIELIEAISQQNECQYSTYTHA